MLVQKLRIYAMLMRLQELEQEPIRFIVQGGRRIGYDAAIQSLIELQKKVGIECVIISKNSNENTFDNHRGRMKYFYYEYFNHPPMNLPLITEFQPEPKVNPMHFDYPKSKYIDKPLRNYRR